MSENVQINQGEINVKFNGPTAGKLTFKDLGIKANDSNTHGGFLRMVFDFEGIGEHHFFKMPTIEIAYNKEVAETHWQCDFNGKTIIDKMDHHGRSTVILLNRKEIESLEQHHENKLIMHAEFPEEVALDLKGSYVNFFK